MCAFMKYYWFMICKPIKVTMFVVSKMDFFYLAVAIVFLVYLFFVLKVFLHWLIMSLKFKPSGKASLERVGISRRFLGRDSAIIILSKLV